MLTAGHCITDGGQVWRSCDTGGTNTQACATWAGGEYGINYGAGGDTGLLAVTNGRPREAGFTDWRNGTRQPVTSYPGFWDTGQIANQTVCHGGATTGYSCGQIVGVVNGRAYEATSDPPHSARIVNDMIFVKWICIQHGDSGGPAFLADMRGAVGIVSGTDGCNISGELDPLRHGYNNWGLLPYVY